MPFDQLGARIDKYAYTNKLADTSPATKIMFALSSLVLCVTSPSPLVPLILFLTNTTLLLKYALIPVRFYWQLFLYPAFTTVLSCIIIALFFGYGEPLTEISFLSFSLTIFKNGVTMAFKTFLRVIGGFSCLYSLVLTTSITDILLTLRKIHIPPILVELSLLIYRYIFLFLEIATQMNTAQEIRLGHSTWKKKIRSLALLAGNLFIRTLDQGERTFTAMRSRGYTGEIRTLDDLPPPKIYPTMAIALFEGTLILLTVMTMDLWTIG